MILTHFTAGQPPRGTEAIGIRYQNTRNRGVRNVFIEDGLVCIVTGYHKGYESTEQLKIIQRFLPREVGEFMAYYLWIIRPFWECVQVIMGEVTEFSPFVWGMRAPSDDDVQRPQD